MIGKHNNKRNKLKNKYQTEKTTHPQFTRITKGSPTKIIVHSINELKSTQDTEITEENNTTKTNKINNIHCGDDIQQEPKTQSTRIFFQNVNGLEFSTTSHTLLETCKGMKDNHKDIACLAETNTNWRHYKGKRKLNKIVRNHWKRAHLTMSNIDN